MLHNLPHRHSLSKRQQGFTLIELLMVIAVILILAGITFGITRGVQNAQARAKAKAELAIISQSLEQYKSVNGDYPWVNDNPKEFAKALMGWKEFNQSGSSVVYIDKTNVPSIGPRAFIDPKKLSYSGTLPIDSDEKPTNLNFTDPWGNEYIYKYRIPLCIGITSVTYSIQKALIVAMSRSQAMGS